MTYFQTSKHSCFQERRQALFQMVFSGKRTKDHFRSVQIQFIASKCKLSSPHLNRHKYNLNFSDDINDKLILITRQYKLQGSINFKAF